MSRKLITGLVTACAVTAAVLVAGGGTAFAGDPADDCHRALNFQPGVCFWPDENYHGKIDAHPNPAPPTVCGNLGIPAKSAINFTDQRRLFYAAPDCKNHIEGADLDPDEVTPNMRGTRAVSWR